MKILRKTNFKGLRKALQMSPEEIKEKIKKSELKGRGGSNFPTGEKIEMTMSREGVKKYIICNADEGEPGTFKDRFILEKNPLNVIEGMLIAARAISAEEGYIYLRGQYSYLRPNIEKAIQAAKKAMKNLNITFNFHIIIGGGAYVCGDETAIIESIEGKRGNPRIKPPFPSRKGLFQMPTLVNNVETLANLPLIFTDKNWNDNWRLFCISGDVRKPGVYELPLGIPLKKAIQITRPKNNIKAIYFGCYGGCIPYDENLILDCEPIRKKGAMLASSLILVDETRSILDISAIISKFFEFESCGQCTPCREGNIRVLELLQKISLKKAKRKDLKLLEELCGVIGDTSLCGLGQSSVNHIMKELKYFKNEFQEKIK
ncbi:MAG: NADH-ubiquinone oxidoreductase-F iron-sulfur binding region domain-containing protein [Candidatus Nanoarchaeia archaeon]|nr:NADH-ubiquinone oxidoreductase-F iron-sulfur binding region domain-containing protein [Candidatus Nanoarchaeia archaeon]